MQVVDDVLRPHLARLVLSSDHPLVPERTFEPLCERRYLLLDGGLELRRAHFADGALLGLLGPNAGLREIVVRPGNTGRTEDAHFPVGAVAYHDEVIGKTVFIDGDGTTWGQRTGGRESGIAADGEHVYTIVFGRNATDPTRLLALSRKTGKTVWDTPLPGAAFKPDHVTITLRDGRAAVHVDEMLYVIDVAAKP
ncbi:MAG: hypothetical protein NT062_29750 [Proteobacteria bacterium]|nr:hypothetical protein [Pseudomonadota bacterium]